MDCSDINPHTEISKQPATTNHLSPQTARKLPDQRAQSSVETWLATRCFPQLPTSGYCCCAHANLPFSAWNKVCGTSSVAQSYWLAKLPPSAIDYRRLALNALLSVTVSPDLQSVPRNIAAKSPTSTKSRKSDSTGRQDRALTSFLLGVDPNKPCHHASHLDQKKRTQTARNNLRSPALANRAKPAK